MSLHVCVCVFFSFIPHRLSTYSSLHSITSLEWIALSDIRLFQLVSVIALLPLPVLDYCLAFFVFCSCVVIASAAAVAVAATAVAVQL